MAKVLFTVNHRFDADPQAVWDELADWAGHANWIPATRVEVAPGDPLAVGAEFTAWTGYGPLTLEDRMRVIAIDWNTEEQHGTCTVEKLGPLLTGTASFHVEGTEGAADMEWVEDITVPYLPQFLAPVAAWIGAGGFKLAMLSLARQMRKSAIA